MPKRDTRVVRFTLIERVAQAVAKSGADGMSIAEIAEAFGHPVQATRVMVHKLTARGLIYVARKFGGNEPGRYFGTEAQAIAWRGVREVPVKIKARSFRDAPVTITDSGLQGDPITVTAKITRDTEQRPTARWQVLELAPDPRWPSFSAHKPGVNPDTGKAWA